MDRARIEADQKSYWKEWIIRDMERQMTRMKALFNPASVAIIGASDKPDKLGFHVMKSLTQGGYQGRIFPVNPGAQEIMGLTAVPSVSACDGEADLAVVVVPASRVAAVFRECAAAGVKGIVLITAGFKEIDDPGGAELHEEIAAIANEAGIPVIGPNTFGMINLSADLNASFTPEFSRLKKGSIVLVSQSGGISHLLAFMAMRMDAGFRMIVGLGNRLNVDFAQMIAFLSDDPDTKVIVLYIEGIDEAGALMQAASGPKADPCLQDRERQGRRCRIPVPHRFHGREPRDLYRFLCPGWDYHHR
jgi:acyl-CoA synthetase (NDP forming)